MPEDTDWILVVGKYVVPAMLVLAILGVLIYQTGGDAGTGSIFKDLGGALFSLGNP